MQHVYTHEEDEFVRQNYLSMRHADIAEMLGKTIRSIRYRANKIGCDKKKTKRSWTKEEDKIILESRGKPLKEVAEILHRNQSDLLKRAHKLGISAWKKRGDYIDSHGYKVDHFRKGKPIWEHRAIAEAKIGRALEKGEVVHHIDLDRKNNEYGNLHVFKNRGYHLNAHRSLSKLIEDNENATELINSGLITFDTETGRYYRAAKMR